MLLLLLAARATPAICTSTEDCLHAIEAAQRDTRTVSAEFAQTKHLTLLDEPLVSTGRLLLKRPDRILLRIETPRPTTVLVRGHEVYIPDVPEHERQALALSPVATMFSELGAIFSGSVTALEKNFEVFATADPTGVRVHLVPRQESWKQMYRSIDIRFGGPQLVIQEIHLDDTLGDSLDITLQHVQRNIDIADAVFDAR